MSFSAFEHLVCVDITSISHHHINYDGDRWRPFKQAICVSSNPGTFLLTFTSTRAQWVC